MFDFARSSEPAPTGAVRAAASRLLGLTAAGAVGLLSACTTPGPDAYGVIQSGVAETATARHAQDVLEQLYPPSYRATQRAIITVGKKQYVCDGVMTASPGAGHHLAVISTLGLVTELRITTNGNTELLRATALFREDWSREFVAENVRLLFAPTSPGTAPGRLSDGSFVLQSPPTTEDCRVRYVFTPDGRRLREVEIERRGARVYHATVRRYRKFAGVNREVPSEITVIARAYRLDLRTAEFRVPLPGNASGPAE